MPESLLPRVADGDGSAVRECLDRYGALVWSMVRRRFGDGADADDVVQEAFVDVWRSAGRFDPTRGTEVQFVAMVTRRRIIDRIRRRASRPAERDIADVSVGSSSLELEQVDVSDEAARARAALERLRPEQRRVLHLSIHEGHTHDEIARRTGMPLGTVKSHARRGLIRMRELLGGGEGAETGVTR